MANSWLRLWHDMPNDPKWKTIARASGQPIALVQAIYVHLMVSASQNVTRGHVDVTIEDLASALDVTEADVSAVIQAMQGRVLDGSQLAGWDRRQPKREDQQGIDNGAKSAAQRKREQRERERQSIPENEHVTKCHDVSRNVTPDKDKDTDKDKDEDTEVKRSTTRTKQPKPAALDFSVLPADLSITVRDDWIAQRAAKAPVKTQTVLNSLARELEKCQSMGITPDDALGHAILAGWRGFQADWVQRAREQQPTGNAKPVNGNHYPSRSERAADHIDRVKRELRNESPALVIEGDFRNGS